MSATSEVVACIACGQPLEVPRPLKSNEWVICGVPVGEPSPCWETLKKRREEVGHMTQLYRRQFHRRPAWKDAVLYGSVFAVTCAITVLLILWLKPEWWGI